MKLVKTSRLKGSRSNAAGEDEAFIPKQFRGTIKRYMNDFHFQMLTLLRKHLGNRYHPIFIICRIFREKFGQAYEKYAKP